mmetsp:Transcript_10937/g.23588  ORF Transcript_10937/g.23588 Transcript_10937/m.23588 type:complete len:305 (-) Transcript_10937:260-1174(-)
MQAVCCTAVHICVALYACIHGLGVAASHGDDHGHSRLQSRAVHEVVALQQALAAQAQPAKAVSLQCIHSRLEEQQLGLVLLHEAGQPLPKHAQVLLITSAVRQGHIVCVAHARLPRIVLVAKHIKGCHPRITLKYACCAVALVHIQVHHQDALHPVVFHGHTSSHRNVIEDAVALASCMECMVCPARNVGGDEAALLKEQPGGLDGAPRRGEGAAHQLQAPGEPYIPHLLRQQLASSKAVDVLCIVHQQQVPHIGAWAWPQIYFVSKAVVLKQICMRACIFLHREAVLCWKRHHMVIGVECHQL